MAPPDNNVFIEDFYPYSFTPSPRYGEGKPRHPQIETLLRNGLPAYEALLRRFTEFTGELTKVGLRSDPAAPQLPNWINGFLPGLDAVAIYGMTAVKKPRLILEIGSGSSTKFAFAAKRAHSPGTSIVSIDPAPRAEIDKICDLIFRTPLQETDLAIFGTLQPGDFVLIDGSHRILQNSDVAVFFLEILPVLKPGVVICIHDIFWPNDYPSPWAKRMYSEQYMLGMLLLFSKETIEILLPAAYVSGHRHLVSLFNDLWNAEHLKGVERHGVSFWFTKK